MTVLQVTTTPRTTWLWAPTGDVADEVRATLKAGWHPVMRADRFELMMLDESAADDFDRDRIVNVEIGVTAYDACEYLLQAGYELRWHPAQSPGNRHHPSVRQP